MGLDRVGPARKDGSEVGSTLLASSGRGSGGSWPEVRRECRSEMRPALGAQALYTPAIPLDSEESARGPRPREENESEAILKAADPCLCLPTSPSARVTSLAVCGELLRHERVPRRAEDEQAGRCSPPACAPPPQSLLAALRLRSRPPRRRCRARALAAEDPTVAGLRNEDPHQRPAVPWVGRQEAEPPEIALQHKQEQPAIRPWATKHTDWLLAVASPLCGSSTLPTMRLVRT